MEGTHLQVPGEADEVQPSSEFSFAVSMNPQESCSSATVDLSPADEIFYHGHLLPLHFLSLSPRSSAESFTRQTNELNGEDSKILDTEREIEDTHLLKGEEKEKSPFLRMPRFGSKKKKKKFDVYKWYERMVKPILGSLRNRGEKQGKKDSPVNRLRFSGDLGMQRNKVMIPVSAPATMRSSPSNSGLLVASGKSTPAARNDGTMEELQAAVEAAIAHCKNSIAAQDKHKQQP